MPFPAPEKRAAEVSDEERRRMYETGWQRGGINSLSYAFTDFHSDEAANATGAAFTREQIRRIVRDPEVAALLSPSHHIGTKRTCVDTGYYEVYNRGNVHLVDVRLSPIQEITPCGIRTAAAEYELETIIFAIGFDAMTGPFLDIDIRGGAGLSLREKWAAGPRTYLGLTVAGFPNLFLVTGPGSPGVLSNMVVSIEQHVDWLTDCIAHLGVEGLDVVEATGEAEEQWVAHVNEIADATLYPQATSWYVGANVPGKPRVFMPYVGGCGRYRAECRHRRLGGVSGVPARPGDRAPSELDGSARGSARNVPLNGYGVLRGKAVDRRREGSSDTPHQIHMVDGDGVHFRIAVNAKSQSAPSDLLYLVADDFQHPSTSALEALPPGWHDLLSARARPAWTTFAATCSTRR